MEINSEDLCAIGTHGFVEQEKIYLSKYSVINLKILQSLIKGAWIKQGNKRTGGNFGSDEWWSISE